MLTSVRGPDPPSSRPANRAAIQGQAVGCTQREALAAWSSRLAVRTAPGVGPYRGAFRQSAACASSSLQNQRAPGCSRSILS